MSALSPERRPAKRSILVTGGSRGIGRAVAERMLERGNDVSAWARFSDGAQAPDGAQSQSVDLSDLDAFESFLAKSKASIEKLDTVVFCAGRGEFGHLEQFSYQRIRALIDLDFTSQAYLARAVLPAMKRRGSGDLVFIGSEAALQGKRQGSIYCAAKFALRGFVQALRDECATSGVRVSIIQPGMVKTGFFDGLDFEPGEEPDAHLLPEDVADAVQAILESRPEALWDEVIISPRKRKVNFKKR